MQLSVEKAYGIGDKRKLKKRKGPPPVDESEHGNKVIGNTLGGDGLGRRPLQVRIQWSDKEGNKLASTDSSVNTTTLAELSRSTKEITVNEHVID